ncbi:MAG: HAMP domain-containing histidine kinase [Verrucomicrobiales bacterium]|nr:HAMP domain-containing histidine kinase [Verrucomicrobiales bacterium]
MLGPVLVLAGFGVWSLLRDWRSARGEAVLRSREFAVAVADRLARVFEDVPPVAPGTSEPPPERRALPGFRVNASNDLVDPPPVRWPALPAPLPAPASAEPEVEDAWNRAVEAIGSGDDREAAPALDRVLAADAGGSGTSFASTASRRTRLARFERALLLERTGNADAAIAALQDIVVTETELEVATLTEAGIEMGCLAALRVADWFVEHPDRLVTHWKIQWDGIDRALHRWSPTPFVDELARVLEDLARSPEGRRFWGREPGFSRIVLDAETRRHRYAAALRAHGTGTPWPREFWLPEPMSEWLVFGASDPSSASVVTNIGRTYRLVHEAWMRDEARWVAGGLDRRGELDAVVLVAGRRMVIAGDEARRRVDGDALAVARKERTDGAPPFEVTVGLADPAAFFAGHRRRAFGFGGLLAGAVLAAGVATRATRRALWRQQELNRQQSNFVSSVSHELRAPLGSIRLLAEGLERGTVPTEDRRQEYFRLIGRETRRLGALVENVLDYSRIEQGRKRYEKEPTDLAALVRDTVLLAERGAGARDVHVDLADGGARDVRDGDRPEAEWEWDVDGRAVQQALLNILDNALKHAPSGSVVRVTLTREGDAAGATQRGRWCRISVRDEGPGIPKSEQRRIFEPFYRRGSELRRETEGIGIGLSIVRHVVEAHGGRVDIESDEGRGATFALVLPGGCDARSEDDPSEVMGGDA